MLPSANNGTGNWWDSFKLTGDNSREAPYGDIYPRLTTKSNTFTVHVRVQTLRQAPGGDPTRFFDPTDPNATGPAGAITAEYRGSFQIERYVDPNATLPDYATSFSNVPAIDTYYKFRTISTKQF